MINHKLLDQVYYVQSTLVRSEEASSEFSNRRIVWVFTQRPSEKWSVEQKSTLRNQESQAKTVNDLRD